MEYVDFEKIWITLVILEYDDEREDVIIQAINKFDAISSTD